MKEYKCEKCNYITNRKSSIQKHLQSKKCKNNNYIVTNTVIPIVFQNKPINVVNPNTRKNPILNIQPNDFNGCRNSIHTKNPRTSIPINPSIYTIPNFLVNYFYEKNNHHSAADPVKGYCLLGTEHSHSPIAGKCTASYEKGDYGTALREFKPLANKGIANAQFNLGWKYRNGKGVPQDDKTAVKWFKLAAEQGHAKSQSNLGVMYQKGKVLYRIMFMPICGEILPPLMGMRVVVTCETFLRN